MNLKAAAEGHIHGNQITAPAEFKAEIAGGIAGREAEGVTTESATGNPKASNMLVFDMEKRSRVESATTAKFPSAEDAAQANELLSKLEMDSTLYNREAPEHPHVRAARKVVERWRNLQRNKSEITKQASV